VSNQETISLSDRLTDYWELTKPGIGLMVIVTAAVGALAAIGGRDTPLSIIHIALATGVLSAGASTLNHWLERHVDQKMLRTARRPVASGRIPAWEALALGIVWIILGFFYLWNVGSMTAAGLGLLSALLYVLAYTPLKPRTTWNTLVGAFPGALPVLIGWTAMRVDLDAIAWLFFAILFVWQFPHFFAIAWIYRTDYAAAGLKMFPSTPLGEKYTGLQSTACCSLLLALTLAPPLARLGGPIYLLGAAACGVYFLAYSIRFQLDPTPRNARLLMASSLVYLPSLLGLLATMMVVRS
jgi:protoheme IX farnesyltransferase